MQDPSSGSAPLEMLCGAFAAATGYPLKWISSIEQSVSRGASRSQGDSAEWPVEVDTDHGLACGQLQMDVREREQNLPNQTDVAALASLLAGLVSQLSEARSALRSSTAELASQASTNVQIKRSGPLGKRIESVLKGAVESLDCAAAGMYLLDEETTELQLRATWGLSRNRLASPPRPLEGANADLEAMLGHAVVLTSSALFDLWNVPEEDFGAAVCVPISTASSVLGTLWIFDHEPRDFEDRETNLLEILAGNLSVELERETLLRRNR